MSNYARYPSLMNRLVVVSGGASGIGASIVENFVACDAKVIFFDLDQQAGEHLAQRLANTHLHSPVFIKLDLTNIEKLQQTLIDIEKEYGPIKVLVNNAARDDRHTIEEVDPEFWRQCMAVNLDHYFFACQSVIESMKKNGGGSIINMSSITWVAGMTGLTGYTAANAAIMGMTRGMARELGKYNIRLNSVIPGWIMTERQKQKWLTPELKEAWLERQCLKEMLEPEEVARLVVFLGADDSRMITSQNLSVDGGYT